jgi:hypothetical protein
MAELAALRRASLASVALLACLASDDFVAGSPSERPPPVVSMIELLAHKEGFEGKLVQVSGFLSVRFEDNALYFDENAYLHTFTENALWVDFDDTDRPTFAKYNKHSGYVIGVFRSSGCNGHLCLYGGRIEGAKPGLMFQER